LHWLYVYATFDISEIATVGQGEVNYQNKKFATFHFDEKREMVIFDECFHEYWGEELITRQQIYLDGLDEKKTQNYIGK